MSNRTRVSTREIIYIFVALLLYFEIYLLQFITAFRYFDELLAVLCLMKVLLEVFKKKLDRIQIYMLLLMLLVLSIGLVSNYRTNLQ